MIPFDDGGKGKRRREWTARDAHEVESSSVNVTPRRPPKKQRLRRRRRKSDQLLSSTSQTSSFSSSSRQMPSAKKQLDFGSSVGMVEVKVYMY